MKRYDSSNIRNVAFLGHQSSGKTSLVESIYYVTGGTTQKGEVDKKTSVSDYLADEQKRGGSIQTAVVPVYYKDDKINLIDLPGSDDFVGEVIGATKVVKGAVLVIDGSVGVQMGTVKAWNRLRHAGTPFFIFINKMDKEGANIDQLLDDIQKQLGKEAIPFTYPLGHAASFDGYANVIDMTVLKDNGVKTEEAELFGDKKAKFESLRGAIEEAVASTSDELLEKYFETGELSPEEIKSGLREGVLKGELVPVLVGSAAKNIGVKVLLDMFIDYLPKPNELHPLEAHDENGHEVEVKTDVNEPTSAFVFKTIVDPYAGTINLVKVNSGVLKSGDEVETNNGNTFRISTLYTMTGKNLVAVDEVPAGDIGAVTRLDGVSTGMTLSSTKNPITYKPTHFPTAVIYKAIVLKSKNDESKIGPALAKIQLEDPTVDVKRNNETRQQLIGGVSSTQLDYILDKLKTLYKIDVDVEPMKIVYRESIKKTAEAEGRYVKQSGGSGFYGVVTMRFEPAEENCFAEEVFGGAVPKNYFPAVEKGFYEAVKTGPLAGFPVIGVKAVLTDGKYHPVDSNEQAFKMASILAFKNAYKNCNPIILEPIMRVKISADVKYTGDIMSDLNTRRAKIQNIEEGDHGTQSIEALVPEAEIIDYVSILNSITQSSGYFNREFVDYEEVPSYLVDKIIKENKIGE